MNRDGVAARCRAVRAEHYESPEAGHAAELRLLRDIVEYTIRRDAGWVADQDGDSLEMLYQAFRDGLVGSRTLPSELNLYADRVHAMACALAAGGNLPLDAKRAVEMVDAIDGELALRRSA